MYWLIHHVWMYSNRQMEVRFNSNFSQTEPNSVGSTKTVALITK